jgi:hypothetical protein
MKPSVLKTIGEIDEHLHRRRTRREENGDRTFFFGGGWTRGSAEQKEAAAPLRARAWSPFVRITGKGPEQRRLQAIR